MNFRFNSTLAISLLMVSSTIASETRPVRAAYTVETIQTPQGLMSETGGLAFLPDGRLVACFIRGEVMIYTPSTKEWKIFASGLHEPLGIHVISNSEFLVMQRPELTRIKDTDADGLADLYEKVTDDFGISGNYHEFNYGPVRDKKGNLYIALNTASQGGSVRPEIRGSLNTWGRDMTPGLYEMYSVVPYRGWVMKLAPGSSKLQPYASGMRSPNGLGFDLEDNLFVTDNQSDWVETSTLYHVREGRFYGHPASLVWNKDWKDRNPFITPVSELDKMRTRAAVLFPQGIMANSPTQPLCDITEGKFGPFEGQLFVGEMNRDRIVRVMLEKVNGELQGACIPFIDGQGLRKGNNRLAFAPDGSLWVGQIAFGWGGDQGIQRIVYNGHPTDVHTMKLTRTGFELTFTEAMDKSSALDPENYKFRHYYYKYQRKVKNAGADNSDQQDIQSIAVKDIKLSTDRKKVSISLAGLKPGYVYELKLGNITNQKGNPLANKLICYTLNSLITDMVKP